MKEPIILIVEDNEIIQIATQGMLEVCGCQCKIVNNGCAAIESSSKSDLVFMDLGLPDISGIAATKKIRGRGVTVPIVALTAHGTKENVRECFDAGMDEFLEKPLSMDKIARILKKYLGPDG